MFIYIHQFSSLSRVQLFVTPRTAAQYVCICIYILYIFFLSFYWTFRLFLIFFFLPFFLIQFTNLGIHVLIFS